MEEEIETKDKEETKNKNESENPEESNKEESQDLTKVDEDASSNVSDASDTDKPVGTHHTPPRKGGEGGESAGGESTFSKSDCEESCKRHFWTELLRSITKIATLVLAAFGLSSVDSKN